MSLYLRKTLGPVAIVLVSLLSAGPHAQDRPASTRLLDIDIVAVDRDGQPVADLRPGDVEVWINEYRVPVESLEWVTPASSQAGRMIVLLMDDLTLDPTMVGRARDVANHFVGRMQPEDRMAVVMLNGGAMELTSDPARLRRRIDSLRQSLGVIAVDQLGEHLLRTVDALARSLIEAPGKRKTIVGIGSAWLLDTPVPPAGMGRDLRREWFDALRSLALADASFYVIDPRGVGASRQIAAQGFARETGGHAFVNTNDLDGAADRILREAANYYVVRVGDPPVGRKSQLRDLDVRTSRKDVTIRARRAIPGGS